MTATMAKAGPNFLVIGAARSGTTALTRFLSQHPEVFITTPKEPHFFAFANSTIEFHGPGDDEMMNRRIVRSPSDYQRLYGAAGDCRHRGDGSVSTLCYPTASIANIRQYAPHVRLILLLREPVRRAYSSYLYLRSRGHEPLDDFAAALAEEPVRTAAGWHHMWQYRALGDYAQQVEPFLEAFGRERMVVVTNERLRQQPDEVMADISRHLDLAPFRFDCSQEVNRGGEARRGWAVGVMNAVRSSPQLKRAASALATDRTRERIRLANLVYPPIDPVVAAQLHEYYADGINRLGSLLDVDLSTWKESPT